MPSEGTTRELRLGASPPPGPSRGRCTYGLAWLPSGERLCVISGERASACAAPLACTQTRCLAGRRLLVAGGGGAGGGGAVARRTGEAIIELSPMRSEA